MERDDVEAALDIMDDIELSSCDIDCGDDIERVDIFDIVDKDKWEKIRQALQRARGCEGALNAALTVLQYGGNEILTDMVINQCKEALAKMEPQKK